MSLLSLRVIFPVVTMTTGTASDTTATQTPAAASSRGVPQITAGIATTARVSQTVRAMCQFYSLRGPTGHRRTARPNVQANDGPQNGRHNEYPPEEHEADMACSTSPVAHTGPTSSLPRDED